MARTKIDPAPANSLDLSAMANEHAVALDALIGVGSVVPGVAYTNGVLTGCDEINVFVDVPDATPNTDIVMPFKGEVVNVKAKKTLVNAGANANSIQLKTAGGAAAISDAISTNGKNRGDLVAAANIDDTGNQNFNAGATLRLVQVKAGGDAAVRVQIVCIVRP